MVNIVDLVDNFHKIEFNIFKTKIKSIDYLNKYKNEKILLIGFDANLYKYDCIPLNKESDIIKNLNNYTLFVISKDFCKLSRASIQRLIDIFKKNNKNVIFSGYSAYLNLNLDNHKLMFRPIDISKQPFNLGSNITILKTKLSKNFTFSFIIILLFSIITNIKYSHYLYKVHLLMLLFIPFILPYHKYIYINNTYSNKD